MDNFWNKILVVVLIILTLGSGGILFFSDQINTFADLLIWKKQKIRIDQTGHVLKIAYLFKPENLSPFVSDLPVQSRLLDVYEGLVMVDKDMNIRPSLAVAYGLVGGTQWNFELRKGVKFHNGKVLLADDVLYSFRMAKQKGDSGVLELLANVEKIEKINDYQVRFTTFKADPLFLNKISKLSIIPSDYADFSKPIGTGAYQVVNAENLAEIEYEGNVNYWGKAPYFQKLEIDAMPVKDQRIDSLLNGDIDFLVNVPPDAVKKIEEADFQVVKMPSLEVGFVVFNFQNELLKNKEVRRAMAQTLNKEAFLDLALGYAKTVNQFVSNGVFGFNPDLKDIAYNEDEAKNTLMKYSSGFENLKMDFYYPQNLKLLGDYFKDQLAQVGIELNLRPLSDQELLDKLKEGQLSFYYLGWRSDYGDALPFFKAVVKNRNESTGDGLYNGSSYDNDKVEELISKSETNLNVKDRLKDMQQIMKIIVDDDVLGVPLFETESLFAMNKYLVFAPRMDSLVYPSSISLLKTT